MICIAKIIETFYGKLISAISKKENEEYDDWRTQYVDCPGLIVIGESNKKQLESKFAYLYPNTPEIDKQTYFHTSLGTYSRENQYVNIETMNSKYIFEEGDFGITQEDKEVLMLNVFASFL